MAEPDHEPAGGRPPTPAATPEPLRTTPKALVQPSPPPPAPPSAAGAGLPLTDLLTLARAILRETGELPAVGTPAAPGPATPPAAAGGNPAAFLSPAQTRGPLPKEQKKFYKLGMPMPSPSPATAEPQPPSFSSPSLSVSSTPGEKDQSALLPTPDAGVVESDPLPGETAADDAAAPESRPRPPGLAKMEERTPGRRRSFTQRQRIAFLLISVLCAGLAFAAGMSFGSLSRPAVPPPQAPAGPGRVTNGPIPAAVGQNLLALATSPEQADRQALKTISEAMNARQARDWPRAAALFERAKQESSRIPGISYRLAEIALRRGEALEADKLITRTQELGENVDESFALRAVLAQRAGNPGRALSSLEAASRANPYETRYWLYQAQLLRQSGKLQEALSRLKEAATRADEPAQIGLIEFITRLTTLELGHEAEFSDELAVKLAVPSPPPDWLLTSAAQDLQRGRFAEGASTMRRALTGQSLPFVMLRMNDVFFRRYANRPELAPLYAELLPSTAPTPTMNLTPVTPPAASADSPADAAPSVMPMSPELSVPPLQIGPTATPAPSPGAAEKPAR